MQKLIMTAAVRVISISALLLLQAPAWAEGGKDSGNGSIPAWKTTGQPARTRFNVNRISTGLWNNGYADRSFYSIVEPGLYYPRGSSKSAVFASGFQWAAKVGTARTLRAGGTEYGTVLQCGKILPGLVPDDPELPKNRIYRVRRDIPPGEQQANISAEIQDLEGDAVSVYAQYWKDWEEWPANDGAPFDDRNANGTYEPSVDVPGPPGADQCIWFVANDLNESLRAALLASTANRPIFGPAMGIEARVTVWGYTRDGALGNMLFKRFTLLNKSQNTFDSMYVGHWSDIDIGDGSDDLAGCDTSRSLAFVYNGAENDSRYAPLPPPAVGFDFFQGPLVAGTSADSGLSFGRWIRGRKNLPMTASNSYSYGLNGDPVNVTQVYNNLKGLQGSTGVPYRDPQGRATPFMFSGDPESRTGWLDGVQQPSGDRRILVCSGPFTMAPGDSQEIVIAEICAGAIEGMDRLSAVGLLKFYDVAAQQAYNSGFQLPAPPLAPVVQATGLDREILLNWGNDPVSVSTIENWSTQGYAFQGYNIYQLPSSSSSLSESRRVATFDLVDGVAKILETDFDPVAGMVSQQVRHFGTDSGIKRYIAINGNALQDNAPLANGVPYYFAVTAYGYNPNLQTVPRSLESALRIFSVIPQMMNPGTRFSSTRGDTVAVVQSTIGGAPLSQGQILPIVIDQSLTSGHLYSVSFQQSGTSLQWSLRDSTTGTTRLAAQTNLSGDDNYLIADGVQVKVTQCPTGMRSWEVPSGRLNWEDTLTYPLAPQYYMEGFGHVVGMAYGWWFSSSTVKPTAVKDVLIKFAGTDTSGNLLDPNDPDASFAYRYLRLASSSAARPSFVPFIKNPGTGYAYQGYEKSIPFAAYDLDASPPRRLMVGHLENNAAGGRVDGKYWPPSSAETGSDGYATSGAREWWFVFDVPYSETPDPSLQKDILNTTLPIVWYGFPLRKGIAGFGSNDEFLIRANHLLGPNNLFSFKAPQNIVDDRSLARVDVALVNVFPNPYYGVNPLERSRSSRFVTFSHLPARTTIRVFNLAGVMVRRIDKDNSSQFERWDLCNEAGLPVGSGLYLAHIDMPDIGVSKVLKIAVVQETQILERY